MAELNYIILKVNGIDVNRLPQNEAVKMFLMAKEPIILEVRRKNDVANIQQQISDRNNIGATGLIVQDVINCRLADLKISTLSHARQKQSYNAQNATEQPPESNTHTTAPTKCEIMANEASPPNPSTTASTQIVAGTENRTYSSKFTQTESCFFPLQHHNSKESGEMTEQEHNLFDQCLAPEIDIEEITLRKSDSNERLGLTVCYSGGYINNGSANNNGALSGSDDNETCTEVYISDIQPDSIAGRDGRLRQGDQILQINGKDIKNKEETESLIAENNNAVTLLVSRYLYLDEDDFNDPSVADLDIEDDDDDEEFYDENNMAYENCFISNAYINADYDLDKVLMSHVTQQQIGTLPAIDKSLTSAVLTSTVAPLKTSTTTVSATDSYVNSNAGTATGTLNSLVALKENSTIRAGKSPKEAELSSCGAPPTSSNSEVMVKVQTQKKDSTLVPHMDIKLTQATHLQTAADYETEHIYETIPEDSESEPFYCSPYESTTYMTAVGSCVSHTPEPLQLQQQKQRVAQWLGLKSHAMSTGSALTAAATIATTAPRQSVRSSSGCGRSLTHYDASTILTTRNRSSTLHSGATTTTNGSSSSGGGGCAMGCATNSNTELLLKNEEHDNSSSAYNTGGSNNSVTPLILVLSQNNRTDALTCIIENAQTQSTTTSHLTKMHNLQSPKDVITSPKHVSGKAGCAAIPARVNNALSISADTQHQLQQQFSPKTTYTNEANLNQNIMHPQQLHRQALSHQQMHPQFTAPNLSQYHFVSSQEVSAAQINVSAASGTTVVVAHKNPNEETTMVWKVKRRQDGTRYIVRRPARNRMLRDRAVRLNTERVRNNEITTTEEDTISEVKTGRYWSKEERKKHIERARERRHQHQQQHHADVSRVTLATTSMRYNSNKPLQSASARSQRYNSTKAAATATATIQQQQQQQQQYHQLQFNSTTVFPATTSSNSACSGGTVASSTDINPKGFLAAKNGGLMNSHICSFTAEVSERTCIPPVTNIVGSKSNVAASSLTLIDILHDPLTPNSTSAAATTGAHQSQDFQTTSDSSKIKNFLSVTTV